jgi:azurin
MQYPADCTIVNEIARGGRLGLSNVPDQVPAMAGIGSCGGGDCGGGFEGVGDAPLEPQPVIPHVETDTNRRANPTRVRTPAMIAQAFGILSGGHRRHRVVYDAIAHRTRAACSLRRVESIMRIHVVVRSFIAVIVLLTAGAAAAAPAAGRLIELTGNDQMKYNLATIAAKPGEALHVRIKSIGTIPKAAMGHNFVLLAKGTDPKAFTNAAANAYATGYIPPEFKAKVLASTTLVGPGESADVTFKAPTAPGTYTFLCSFPGHFLAGMKGTLVVK